MKNQTLIMTVDIQCWMKLLQCDYADMQWVVTKNNKQWVNYGLKQVWKSTRILYLSKSTVTLLSF